MNNERVSAIIEYGMCDGDTLQPHHKSPLKAESLYEAMQKITSIYGIESYCYQAIPSKFLIESEKSLYDMIEIIPRGKDSEKRAVCLRLPFEMTKRDIEMQLPTGD